MHDTQAHTCAVLASMIDADTSSSPSSHAAGGGIAPFAPLGRVRTESVEMRR
jgi:hypothetical protein